MDVNEALRPKHYSTYTPNTPPKPTSPPNQAKTNNEPKSNSTRSSKRYPPLLPPRPCTPTNEAQRSQLLTSLSRLLDSDPTPSALKSTNLSRHREILTQHRTELLRLRNTLSTARDRANLLSNVRSDISAYRASTTNPENAESEYMLQERTRLDRSHNVADSVLSQAYAVNESFGIQRESLQSIQRRITGAAGKVPGINGLMQRIGSKKRRDGIILGSFIAVCVLVLFWFW